LQASAGGFGAYRKTVHPGCQLPSFSLTPDPVYHIKIQNLPAEALRFKDLLEKINHEA
jgi:hypothetical protein